MEQPFLNAAILCYIKIQRIKSFYTNTNLKKIRLTYFASVRNFSNNEYILFLKSFITIYHFDQFSFNF